MSYKVEYKDIGLRDFKETWDLQENYFSELTESKKTAGNGISNSPGTIPGKLIFVEHPHVYTLGKSGSENNLLLDFIQLKARNASFYRIDRGGDITYHGPGQLVGYPIFDLEAIGIGLKEYIHRLEEAIICSLVPYGIKGERLEGATGVWIDPRIKGRARKICAIGVRASRYVTMHGFALNMNTDLAYFGYINPCGFTDKGVTSVAKETGTSLNEEGVKKTVRDALAAVFDLELVIQTD